EKAAGRFRPGSSSKPPARFHVPAEPGRGAARSSRLHPFHRLARPECLPARRLRSRHPTACCPDRGSGNGDSCLAELQSLLRHDPRKAEGANLKTEVLPNSTVVESATQPSQRSQRG